MIAKGMAARIDIPPGQTLLALSSLADPSAKGLSIEADGRTVEIFIVHAQQTVRGYVNVCPHRATPLDWVPDQFLDLERTHILCATHGARFRIDDGVCVAGPCLGGRLTPIALRVRDGLIETA